MNKKFIILEIVFLILINLFSVNGALTDGLMAYWSFDGNAEDNTTNNRDFIVTNAQLKQGISGQAYYFDGTDDYLNYDDSLNDFDFNTNNNNYNSVKTIILWINSTSLTDDIILNKWGLPSVTRWGIYSNTNCESGYNICDGWESAGTIWKGIGSLTTNKWYMIAIRRTTSNNKINLSVNASTMREVSGTATSPFTNTGSLRIGCISTDCTSDYNGYVDEVGLWNRTLTDLEIIEIYNSVLNGVSYPFTTGGINPEINLLSDLVNGSVTNETNFNFYLNASSINNSNFYSCNLFADGTLKNSFSNQDLTTSKNLSMFLFDTYSQYFNFTIDCYNENASANLSALYYIDNNKSILNYINLNGTFYNDEVLYTNFSISDENLFSFEFLVYQGIVLKENITKDYINTPEYSVYNLSSVSQIVGNYNWVLNIWENHNPLTSPELFSEYVPTKTLGAVSFISPNDETINYKISSKELLNIETETKDLKQYFNFIPDEKVLIKPKFYTYYLEYEGDLIYLPESKYKGHFVLWDIKKYVDFQCSDYVKVFKETDNKYRIETPCVKFETTGNLNFQQFTGNFSINTPPSLSDEYILSLNETNAETNIILGEINLNIINIYEVLSMLGFILINALYLVIINYIIQPIDKRLYFIGIIPVTNLILTSFDVFGLSLFTEYILNTYLIISSILLFVSLIILYTLGLFIKKDKTNNKNNFYSNFN